jgi:4-hydroxybenzoate polyprenyltransferase
MNIFFKTIRVYQWPKNVLVFIPMLASHQLNLEIFYKSFLIFAIFCFAASCIYIFNDLRDVEADRAHPRKKFRPYASGKISKKISVTIMLIFFLTFVTLSLLSNIETFFIILIYILTNIIYTIKIKLIFIIDILFLAFFHTARILAGGMVTGIDVSFWLLIFSIFLFLSLAAVKRQSEILNLKKIKSITILRRGYSISDLPIVNMIAIGAGVISVFIMMLYINSSAIILLYSRPEILWGVCLILLYWISRTILISYRSKMVDDPIIFAYKDFISWFCLSLSLTLIFLGI